MADGAGPGAADPERRVEPARGDGPGGPYPRPRRAATAQEAKALGHPLRLRILRLCLEREYTNRALADRLETDPATVLYHVRRLVDAGFLVPGSPRTGARGALEKPYRATGLSWWLDDPLDDRLDRVPGDGSGDGSGEAVDRRLMPFEAFRAELAEAGPEAVATQARFVLHLSPEQVRELDRRLLAVLDEYVETDHLRSDRPAHGGIILLHRMADDAPPPPASRRS